MKNIIYKHTWRPATDAPSGGEAGLILVTEEINGFIVWITGKRPDPILYCWTRDRDEAIITAVDRGRELANGLG